VICIWVHLICGEFNLLLHFNGGVSFRQQRVIPTCHDCKGLFCFISSCSGISFSFPFFSFLFFPLCFPFDCCIYIPPPDYRLSTYLKSSVCSVCAGSDVCIRFFSSFLLFLCYFLHFYILGGVRHDREESDVFLSNFCGTNWGRNWSLFLRTCGGLLVADVCSFLNWPKFVSFALQCVGWRSSSVWSSSSGSPVAGFSFCFPVIRRYGSLPKVFWSRGDIFYLSCHGNFRREKN